MGSEEDLGTFTKSWNRAMRVRKNHFTIGLEQSKNRLDIDYSEFLRKQHTQKKKLVGDLKKRQKALALGREKVEDALRRQKALSRSTEDLRRDISLAEDKIFGNDKNVNNSPSNSCFLTTDVQSRSQEKMRLEPITYSRSTGDLRTLVGDGVRKSHDEQWGSDSGFKLPRLQPIPPIYIAASSLVDINKLPSRGCRTPKHR